MNNFSEFMQDEFLKICLSNINSVVFVKIKVIRNWSSREIKERLLEILIIPKTVKHFKVDVKFLC